MLLNRLRGPSLAVLTCALGALALSACATTGDAKPRTETASTAPAPKDRTMAPGLDGWANTDPYPSTYRGLPRENLALVGATVLTGTGQKIEGGVVIVTASTPAVSRWESAGRIPRGRDVALRYARMLDRLAKREVARAT